MNDDQASAAPTGTSATTRKGLVPAIRDLTEGTTELIRHHFELLRIELKREATEAGEHGGVVALGAGIALLGYLLLNLTVILAVGWWTDGIGGMTLATLVLGVGHAGLGGWLAVSGLGEFREQQQRIERKTRTLTGKQTWLEENPES
jgi:hypothetical protein